MKYRIFFWSITSALAGFLFGFDTVVISGAEQRIQALWGLNAGMHGLALGSALYGTVLGSLLGGWPTDKFGRKKTLLFIGVLYVLSAVGCGFANGVGMFIAVKGRRCLALDARYCGHSVRHLRRDVLGPARKPAVADRPQGRPPGGNQGVATH